MYDNIGNKIKILAKTVCLLGIIGSVIFGLIVCFGTGEFRAIGLLYVLIGSIMSWISSFITYGFGELIEKVCSIDKKINFRSLSKEEQEKSLIMTKKFTINLNQELEEVEEENNTYKKVEHKWRCSNCGKMISEDVCPFCGNK